MAWMNEYEVNEVRVLFSAAEFSNLHKGAQALGRLMDWTNGCSDGWPYWQLPAKSAAKLMDALHEAREKRWSELDDISDAELKKLLRPIRTFLTGRDIDPATVLDPPPPPVVVPGVEVAGKIVIDGVVSEFRIVSDAEFLYQQWGADIPVLGDRVELLHAMATAVRNWDMEAGRG